MPHIDFTESICLKKKRKRKPLGHRATDDEFAKLLNPADIYLDLFAPRRNKRNRIRAPKNRSGATRYFSEILFPVDAYIVAHLVSRYKNHVYTFDSLKSNVPLRRSILAQVYLSDTYHYGIPSATFLPCLPS